MRQIVRLLLLRPGWVLIATLLSSVPMIYWSVLLFSDLRADLSELLPENADSVRTLKKLEQRFGGWSELLVLIESPNKDANRRLSDDIKAEMSSIEDLRSVRNRLGEEGKFFADRRHFFLELGDLEEILERMEDAAFNARKKANPLFVDLEEEPESLDFSDIEAKYARKLGIATRFPNDYFENADGTQVVIVARKRGLAFGIEANRRVIDQVRGKLAKVNPESYQPGIRVSLGGDVQNLVDEHTSLVEDLTLATSVVTVLLLILVIGYYREVRAVLLISVPVLVGCAWTFGLSHFLIGYLNASSAFLGPIIPGNGMNFGLILLARYLEERRKGQVTRLAAEDAAVFTAKATALAAFAASISYGSLMITDFRGFRHFGIIGGLGMVTCWLTTFLVMPPLMVVTDRRPTPATAKTAAGAQGELPRWAVFVQIAAILVRRGSAVITAFGLCAGLGAAWLTARFLEDPFEKDFRKLRSTIGGESGTAALSKKVDAIFGNETTPQVLLADRLEDVPLVVDHLEKLIAESKGEPLFVDVTALDRLVPHDQPEKIAVLDKIRKLLTPEVLASLSDEHRALAEKHRPPEGLVPFGLDDLPPSIRADFREIDGREGLVVLVTPNLRHNLYHADVIRRVADQLRAIPLPGGRVVESSGTFVIWDDMLRYVATDGPKATLVSLAGVIILCFLAYRRVSQVLPVVISLLLGVCWLGAYMALSGVHINFLNFIALPITFGIGVDYAVNLYTRYRLERLQRPLEESLIEAMTSTGGAVVLCSMTTTIGYASLLIARNGSLVSFGKVAIVGELTCLLAAMLVLPASIAFFGRRFPSPK